MDSKLSQQQLMYCIRIIFIFVLKYSWMNLFLSFCFIWRYSSVFESLIWLCLSFSVLYLESFSWLCFIFIKRYSSILSHFLDFVFNWRYFLEFLSTFFDDFIFVSNFDLVLHFRFHFILKTKTSHQANAIGLSSSMLCCLLYNSVVVLQTKWEWISFATIRVIQVTPQVLLLLKLNWSLEREVWWARLPYDECGV